VSRTLLFGGNDAVPPARIGGLPKSFDVQVQDIASAAHKRGVILLHRDAIVGSLEAADLCRTMRSARENTRGDQHRFRHVAQLVNGVHVRLGQKGAVSVSRSAWGLLQGYSRPKAAK